MKLFIADDSDLVREKLSMFIAQLDNVEIIGHADTVQASICGVRQLNPDVIVLDIKMPGGCGIDVLEYIKRGGSGPVVIMLTNYSYPQYEKRCIDAGADFFFDKSQEFGLAIQTIERLASRQAPGEVNFIPSSGGDDVMRHAMHQHPLKSIPPFTERRRTEQKEVNLEEVVRNLQVLLPERANGSIETQVVLAGEELAVMIDMAQIELAILNLIRNAWEAMPGGGNSLSRPARQDFQATPSGKEVEAAGGPLPFSPSRIPVMAWTARLSRKYSSRSTQQRRDRAGAWA